MTKKEKITEKIQYISFIIAREEYGVELIQTKEIIKPLKITPVPNTSDYISGVINLRGQVIPVIDMKKKLNLAIEKDKASSKDEEKIIIINIKGMLLGLYVDCVKEVVNLKNSEIKDVKETKNEIEKEFIKGVINIDEKLIIILDLKKLLFTKKEKKGA